MHHFESAETLLKQALQARTDTSGNRAGWLAALADLQAQSGRQDEARQNYVEAMSLAGNDGELQVGIRLGQAQWLSPAQRIGELTEIATTLSPALPPAAHARFLANIAAQARSLGDVGEPLAYDSYNRVGGIADAPPRIRAEALGGLAQLFEDRGQSEDALRIDLEGIRIAESLGARDLLLELEWRRGRLHRSLQQNDAALAAYQRALEHIEAIRLDIPVEYHDGRSSFRETLEPVYLGLADLLLQKAGDSGGPSSSPLLARARTTVELIKQSELEDFLGGRCAVESAKTSNLEVIEPHTAVLYPIILPDRLELLISNGTELRHFSQPVAAATLQKTVQELAKALRYAEPTALVLSQQLYRWMIAPAESWLKEQQVKTLVVVPDGVLRLIPLGALHDGRQYLIERYAVAISPGLSLIEPHPLSQQGNSALIAGMSRPGPVLENLPDSFMASMDVTPNRGLQVVKSRALPRISERTWADDKSHTQEMRALLRDPQFVNQLRESLALPGVDREIASLQKEVKSKSLMNESFTLQGFKTEVLNNAYSVVHIASHGVFGSSASNSFIMAFDRVIDMDELENILHSDKFKEHPLELLTLSACQTAEGDDRAPLGISGIALKARVRSSLGTLWPVNDDAAARVMAEFYRQLGQKGVSKIEALQKAQLSVLKEAQFQHPFFWSPFILVGNWL
jgi:CHAT domain-containing protein